MAAIDLKDYVCGGYFITKPSVQGFMRTPNFQPEQVMSLSNCIARWFISPAWGWQIEQNKREILWWGIPETKFDQLHTFSVEMFEKDYYFPNVFLKLSSARQFIKKFLPNAEGVILLGAGLPKNLGQNFLSRKLEPLFNAKNENIAQDLSNVSLAFSQNILLRPGGQIIGFEVASYAYNSFGHSWLCSNLQSDMHEQFGINAGDYGLLKSYDDAMKVYEWIAEDDMQGRRAEPEPYFPWLIVQYPVN